MQRFSELTDAQLVSLSNDELMDAIKVEAIQRNIKPPVSLSEAIRLTGFQGHTSTKDDLTVYKVGTENTYEEVGWLTEEEAIRASQGAVVLGSTYKHNRSIPFLKHDGTVIVKRVVLPGEPEQYKIAKIQEYVNEDAELFESLVEACTNQIQTARQEAYNRKVATERKAEYLRLANGDEAIAKAFWAKAETLAWPEGEGV